MRVAVGASALVAALVFVGPALAVVIDNDLALEALGFFSADVTNAGDTEEVFITVLPVGGGGPITDRVVFEYFSFVDPGNDGAGLRLGDGTNSVPAGLGPEGGQGAIAARPNAHTSAAAPIRTSSTSRP